VELPPSVLVAWVPALAVRPPSVLLLSVARAVGPGSVTLASVGFPVSAARTELPVLASAVLLPMVPG
jgi:hypothetical protein